MKLASGRFLFFLTTFVLALVAMTVSIPLDAQVLYGTLTGNITDPSGADVPRATVVALNTATGATRQATSDEHGVYVFNDLQAGSYKITVTAPSFATVVEPGVEVAVNTVRRIDLQLQLAQVNQTINVEASAVT